MQRGITTLLVMVAERPIDDRTLLLLARPGDIRVNTVLERLGAQLAALPGWRVVALHLPAGGSTSPDDATPADLDAAGRIAALSIEPAQLDACFPGWSRRVAQCPEHGDAGALVRTLRARSFIRT